MKSTKVQNPRRFYSACVNTIRRRNNALIYVVKYNTHARFPRSIKDGRLAIAVLYRKRSNSATEHFQRKPHKCMACRLFQNDFFRDSVTATKAFHEDVMFLW